MNLKMTKVKMKLNQERQNEDHSEQFDVQTIMDILNVLTQQR